MRAAKRVEELVDRIDDGNDPAMVLVGESIDTWAAVIRFISRAAHRERRGSTNKIAMLLEESGRLRIERDALRTSIEVIVRGGS